MRPGRKQLADIDAVLLAELSKRELEERSAREKGDLAGEVDAVAHQANLHDFAGRHSVARRVLGQVIERCRTASDERAEAHARCARAAIANGDPGEEEPSREDLAFALAVFERLGDRVGLATALEARAALLRRWDDSLDEARADQHRAVAIRRELGSPGALVESLRLLTQIELSRRDWPGADAALSEAERVHGSSDLPPASRRLLRVSRMLLSLEQGQWVRTMGLLVQLSLDAAKRMAANGVSLGLALALYNRRQSGRGGQPLTKEDLSLDDPIARGALPPEVLQALKVDDDEKPS